MSDDDVSQPDSPEVGQRDQAPPGRPASFDGHSLFPTLLTLALCLWRLGQRQLWRDELSTWWAASRPLPDLARLLEHVDFVLTPYYLLMHGWVALFGDTPGTLRLPSALAMVGATWLLTKLGRALFDARTGMLAGVLFALTPSVSAFGQEARPYALALLCCIAASLQLKRALDVPEAWRRWLGYAALLIATGLFHIVALTVLAAHAVAVVRLSTEATRRRVIVSFVATLMLVLLVVAPIVYVGSQQSSQIEWITADLNSLFEFPGTLFASPIIAGMVMFAGLLGLARAGAPAAWLGVWALFPPFFLFVSFHWLHLFLPRYMLFTLPAWILLAAHALVRWHRDAGAAEQDAGLRAQRWLPALALLLVFSLEAQAPLRERTPQGHWDYKTIALAIDRRAEPGDAIAYAGPRSRFAWLAFRYLLRRKKTRLRDVSFVGTAEEVGDWSPAPCPDATQCLTTDVKRVWLVSTTKQDLFEGVPEDLARLLAAFDRGRVRSAPKLRYVLFTRRISAPTPEPAAPLAPEATLEVAPPAQEVPLAN